MHVHFQKPVWAELFTTCVAPALKQADVDDRLRAVKWPKKVAELSDLVDLAAFLNVGPQPFLSPSRGLIIDQ